MELLKPFGPTIGKFTLPEAVLEELLLATDKTLKEKKQRWGDNLEGRIEDEWRLVPGDVQTSVIDYFHSSILEYAKSIDVSGDELKPEIRFMWVNEMREYEYNPIHAHPMCDFSSAIFLKIPDLSSSNISSNKKGRIPRDGHLAFLHHTNFEGNSGVLNIVPEVGDFYLFPAYLMHLVYPYKGGGVRRSISFNTTLKRR